MFLGSLGTRGCRIFEFFWFLGDFCFLNLDFFLFFCVFLFFLFFFVFWGVVWKFWREALGLFWGFSVGCKDSSGLVGFDYDGLHFFTPLEKWTEPQLVTELCARPLYIPPFM